jgi:hypothetical protein
LSECHFKLSLVATTPADYRAHGSYLSPQGSFQYSRRGPFAEFLNRLANRSYDILIACASADVARQSEPNIIIGVQRIIRDQINSSHQHACGTEATLKAMIVPKGLLKRVHIIKLTQTFYGSDFAAVSLDSEHKT